MRRRFGVFGSMFQVGLHQTAQEGAGRLFMGGGFGLDSLGFAAAHAPGGTCHVGSKSLRAISSQPSPPAFLPRGSLPLSGAGEEREWTLSKTEKLP